MQIVQFVIDLFVVYFGSKQLFVLSYAEILSSNSLPALYSRLLALAPPHGQLRRHRVGCIIGMWLTL